MNCTVARFLWLCIGLGLSSLVGAQNLTPAWARTLHVKTLPLVGELSCPHQLPKKVASVSSDPEDPLVIPDEEVVVLEQAEFQASSDSAARAGTARPEWTSAWLQAQPYQSPFRIALWGDSHMAAGFFSAELIRLLGLGTDETHSAFIPATMNRAGVRLPVRKTCVSAGWRYESAHVSADSARAPGPALVNLFSAKPNESLVWDLRTTSGQAYHSQITLLFQQTSAPIRLALRVDQGAEQELMLNGPAGPGRLTLVGDGPLSVVMIRLLEGDLRVHGVQLQPPDSTRLQFDLFGFPGATVAGWKSADTAYLKSWFNGPDLQLAILAYGTNEGNQKPFNPVAYRDMMEGAVQNLKAVFPHAACLLIAPGDRGILIPRSKAEKIKRKAGQRGKSHAKKSPAVPTKRASADLFVYSRIHQQIGDIQKEVASQYGCMAWSMFDAMGGMTSAYTWARQPQPLMAPDLIHFTIKGYESLARKLAQEIMWSPQLLWNGR